MAPAAPVAPSVESPGRPPVVDREAPVAAAVAAVPLRADLPEAAAVPAFCVPAVSLEASFFGSICFIQTLFALFALKLSDNFLFEFEFNKSGRSTQGI